MSNRDGWGTGQLTNDGRWTDRVQSRDQGVQRVQSKLTISGDGEISIHGNIEFILKTGHGGRPISEEHESTSRPTVDVAHSMLAAQSAMGKSGLAFLKAFSPMPS